MSTQIYRWQSPGEKFPEDPYDMHWRYKKTKLPFFTTGGEFGPNEFMHLDKKGEEISYTAYNELEYLEQITQSIPLTKEDIEKIGRKWYWEKTGITVANNSRPDLLIGYVDGLNDASQFSTSVSSTQAQESRTDLLMENVELKERIKELEDVWIPVNKRLPTKEDASQDGYVQTYRRDDRQNSWPTNINHSKWNRVSDVTHTHWMGLPKKP